MGNRPRDDQRRTGLIDQNAVDLVDDRIIVAALHNLRRFDRHTVVAKIVEAELAVGAISDITGILFAAFRRVHMVLDAAYRQPQILEHMPHPLRIAPGQIVVDRHQPNVFSGQRVEVERQRRHQRFAFTGLHLGNFALMQHNAADELDIERNHVPCELVAAHIARGPAQPAASILDNGERLAQDSVQRLACRHTLFELLRLGLQLLFGKSLISLLDLVDALNQRLHPFYVASVLCPKKRFNEIHESTLSLKPEPVCPINE